MAKEVRSPKPREPPQNEKTETRPSSAPPFIAPLLSPTPTYRDVSRGSPQGTPLSQPTIVIDSAEDTRSGPRTRSQTRASGIPQSVQFEKSQSRAKKKETTMSPSSEKHPAKNTTADPPASSHTATGQAVPTLMGTPQGSSASKESSENEKFLPTEVTTSIKNKTLLEGYPRFFDNLYKTLRELDGADNIGLRDLFAHIGETANNALTEKGQPDLAALSLYLLLVVSKELGSYVIDTLAEPRSTSNEISKEMAAEISGVATLRLDSLEEKLTAIQESQARPDSLEKRVTAIQEKQIQAATLEEQSQNQTDLKLQEQFQSVQQIWETERSRFKSEINMRVEKIDNATKSDYDYVMRRIAELEMDKKAKIKALGTVIDEVLNRQGNISTPNNEIGNTATIPWANTTSKALMKTTIGINSNWTRQQ
jgi:hypothetical protein